MIHVVIGPLVAVAGVCTAVVLFEWMIQP
ncbi:hypothetical protein LCGC14_2155850, partial [marine sediment metagenome]